MLLLLWPHRYLSASVPVNGFFVRNVRLAPPSTFTASLTAASTLTAARLEQPSQVLNVHLTRDES